MKFMATNKITKTNPRAKSSYPEGGRQKNSTITFEQIENRAYHLWLKKGGRHGKDLEDWLQAKQELEAEENLSA